MVMLGGAEGGVFFLFEGAGGVYASKTSVFLFSSLSDQQTSSGGIFVHRVL